MTKSYTGLSKLKTFEERYEYLKIGGSVGKETFGSKRYLNQALYSKDFWKKNIRLKVIARDNGCDLGIRGREIPEGVPIYVHHIIPITIEDVLERRPIVFDLDNLITTTKPTHDAIHYGNSGSIIADPVERTENDTCPWRH